jgi:hypothetical protein
LGGGKIEHPETGALRAGHGTGGTEHGAVMFEFTFIVFGMSGAKVEKKFYVTNIFIKFAYFNFIPP